ncbi:MAG: glycoside hydrolase family 3 C-terminal domain-containing protein [Caldilineaceae bacterium]
MSSENIFVPMQTVLAAIRDKVSNARYAASLCARLHCPGVSPPREFAAVAAAQRADMAIVVVGDKSTSKMLDRRVHDRSTLTLPGVQEELVKAVVATGTPTVVVYTNGRPVSSPWIAEHADAILEAWFPGEGCVADVLFGDRNPGSRCR